LLEIERRCIRRVELYAETAADRHEGYEHE
jgi:hypothetical protein